MFSTCNFLSTGENIIYFSDNSLLHIFSTVLDCQCWHEIKILPARSLTSYSKICNGLHWEWRLYKDQFVLPAWLFFNFFYKERKNILVTWDNLIYWSLRNFFTWFSLCHFFVIKTVKPCRDHGLFLTNFDTEIEIF